MFALAGGPSHAGSPLTWNVFFARQPEPDLEFTEEELEQTANVRSSAPMKPPKQSGGRPILWILLLILVGGGAYVAMEPEMITDVLGPLFGESSAPPAQPPVAMTPPRPAPAPGTSGSPSDMTSSAPTPPPVPMPQGGAPSSVPTPAPGAGMPAVPTPGTPPMPASPATPPIVATPTPLFGEGQKVTAMMPPATAGDTVTLMQDAAGSRPGPAVRVGSPLTILDGDLQSTGWVYAVRSDDGAKGWVPESRLRLKP